MKLHRLLLLLLIWSTSPALLAQLRSDSLLRDLAKPLPDSTRIALSDQLLREYLSHRQFDDILQFTGTMLEESVPKKDKRTQQMAMIFRAVALNAKGDSEAAIQFSKKGAQLSFEISDSLQAAKHLTNVGAFFQQKGQRDSALAFYLRAYPIYQSLNERQLLSSLLNNIGVLYRLQKSYDKALDTYQEALAIRESLGDTLGMATVLMNMGSVYGYIDQLPSAETCLLRAIGIFSRMDAANEVANCNNVLGQIYFNLDRPAAARAPLESAYAYFRENPDPWQQTGNAFNLGLINYQEGQYAQAERFFEEAIQHSQTANRWGDKQELYSHLSKVKYALGKPGEAYSALLTAFEHLDSIKEERRLELIEENLAHFEVLQKEKELALNQLELERRTRQRNGLITGLLVLLLAAIGMFLFLRQRILIAKQKAELQKQRIQQLQQEAKLAALNAIIEGEEKERMRIAADLHDGLGGLLTSIKSHYTQLAKASAPAALHGKTSQIIDEACAEVRRIAYNLAPQALAVAGLQGVIEDLCLSIKSQGLDCELELIGLDESQLGDKSVNIYRIVQELCHNAVKHAQAEHLFVQLFQKDDSLSILVEDDGRGFDYSEASQKKGLGLSSIASRAKAMGGETHWYTEPGQGTSVSILIPLKG